MTWIPYSERRPENAGIYRWRLPSKTFDGFVTFFAHHRSRGAGFETVLSPAFDYWDGYTVSVPDGTEWMVPDGPPPETRNGCCTGLEVEGVELLPCPFCKQTPRWVGIQRSINGGVYMSYYPHLYNDWWLECCGWAKSPHGNPLELAAERNSML